MNNIIVTFAIPTYNRANKVEEILREILQYREDTIEVLLSDASTNNETYELVNRIGDKRVRYLVRGNSNSTLQLLNNAKGKYFMFLLDKDMVISKYIKLFIEFLTENEDIVYGRCLLPFEVRISKNKFEIFEKGFMGVKELGYRVWHPSGFFLNREKCLNSIKKEILEGYTYFWYAELAIVGKGVYCQIPIIKTESPKEAAKVKTHSTVSGKSKQMFFSPKYQKELFRSFTDNLYNLPIGRKEKRIIMLDIFFRHLNAVTFQYREVMKDKQICLHYKIRPQKITNRQLVANEFDFYKEEFPFMCNTMQLSVKEKAEAIFWMVRNEIKRIYNLIV